MFRFRRRYQTLIVFSFSTSFGFQTGSTVMTTVGWRIDSTERLSEVMQMLTEKVTEQVPNADVHNLLVTGLFPLGR